MPEQFTVTVGDILPEFLKLKKNVDMTQAFPHTLAAIKELAASYAAQWRRFTMGEPMPGTPRRIWSRGPYTQSIQVEDIGPSTAAAVSVGPWTRWFEEGHGEIDLKPGMLKGPKARLSKDGTPYNIIAFRHGTGGLPSNNPMPINVYNIMKYETNKADQAYKAGRSQTPGVSKITGVSPTPNIQRASGAMDVGRIYQWGYRLPAQFGGPAETKDTSKGQYQWKTGKYTSMVRMQANTSKAKSSTYITFRTVSIHSDPASWIVPALEALPIRQIVMDYMKDYTTEMLKDGLEKDLQGGGR